MPHSLPTLQLAMYQCAPQPLDVPGNLQRMQGAAQQAKARGADLLVFPEMFLTGYAIGHAAVQQLAQAADGESALAVAAIAQEHGLSIVYGYPERDAQGLVYNTAQWISASGERLLNYRKTHLYGALDRAQFAQGTSTSTLLDFGGWKVGLLICYDVEFPENTRRLALAGADLIVVPTANMPEYEFVMQTLLPVRAFENQLFIAYANYVGAEGPVHYGGQSTVVAPDGGVLHLAGRDTALSCTALPYSALQDARTRQTHVADLRARTGP